ncbi:MAG: hypothetical protein AAFY91_14875 [Bacteroidota bacterium]
MAKKRFTDGLFDLFEPEVQPAEENGHAATEGEAIDVEVPVTPRNRQKLGRKNFTQGLDAYLSDSFTRETNTDRPKRRRRRSGLDLLIQSTVNDDPDRQPKGGNTAETKRVTLIFNKEHLATLKDMAKTRKMYLKDLVGEMVEKYLDKE